LPKETLYGKKYVKNVFVFGEEYPMSIIPGVVDYRHGQNTRNSGVMFGVPFLNRLVVFSFRVANQRL
jgi:hypothetical protein